jgi:ribosomal-protein-alanine N-acetyltransferase
VKAYPTLETKRLVLRPFTLADAPAIQTLAGDKDIAHRTLSMPHPYEDGMAEAWISTHQETYEKGEDIRLAITRRADDALIGAIGLEINQQHARAEAGYWIGKPFWNQGYCTEALKAVIEFGFQELGLNRIQACHFGDNPASGRVMQKAGMTYEGCRRQHVKRLGAFKDLEGYSILRSEYEQSRQ